MAFTKPYGGEDCITCCEVQMECDCDLLSCVMYFYTYALNVNKAQYTGHLANEVAFYGMKLVGFAALGSYERPVIGGLAQVTFGRSLVQALIDEWQVEGTDMQTELQEIYRIFSPYLDAYLANACGCPESEENKVTCDALKCVMETIRSFGTIGIETKPPYTLKEWAEGGLCGVCYTDCEGGSYTFNKAPLEANGQ